MPVSQSPDSRRNPTAASWKQVCRLRRTFFLFQRIGSLLSFRDLRVLFLSCSWSLTCLILASRGDSFFSSADPRRLRFLDGRFAATENYRRRFRILVTDPRRLFLLAATVLVRDCPRRRGASSRCVVEVRGDCSIRGDCPIRGDCSIRGDFRGDFYFSSADPRRLRILDGRFAATENYRRRFRILVADLRRLFPLAATNASNALCTVC